MLLLYSHFSKKSLQFPNVFYRSVFRCKVLRLFVFYLFEVRSTVTASSSSQRENVLIQYLFLTREGKKLLRYLYKITKNHKSCVCIKYLTLVRPRKLIPVNFAFICSIQNAQNSSIAKKLFISQFFKQIKLCLYLLLFKKKVFTSKNVYVIFTFTSLRLLEQCI